jgi:spore coat polysaccharide biosynthesis protein SpsF
MHLGALIPVRLGSSRLPGKALLPIQGVPVLQILLRRIIDCSLVTPENIVVCTTHRPEDESLRNVVEDAGCSLFKGPEDDLILRFKQAVDHFGFDAVLQVDGDDPLTDSGYMAETLKALIEDSSREVVSVQALPLGLNSKSFTRDALNKVASVYRSKINDTGFSKYFTDAGVCRHTIIKPLDPGHVLDGVRLTMDYQEDFDLISTIISSLSNGTQPPNVSEIVSFLRANPDLAASNLHVEKTYWQRHQSLSRLRFVDADGTTRDL